MHTINGEEVPPEQKVRIFLEALPYVQKFRDSIFVIKYGGAAMEDPMLVERTLRDIVLLEAVGIHPLIIHGGGEAINKAMKAQGMSPKFINGIRVTDKDLIALIEKVLCKEIGPFVAQKIIEYGAKAVFIPGYEVFSAVKWQAFSSQGDPIDYGYVGSIVAADIHPLLKLLHNQLIVVVSPLAKGENGEIYNVNADIAASKMAKFIKAKKLIYLTNTSGILADEKNPTSTISVVDKRRIDALKKEGTIHGGMIPKVESALEALESGVEKVHFLDGRMPHALLLEIFTDKGIGTEIIL
ncbi:acetylglutamate kinase [Candidatus Methylacidiphilum fumarolicum]|uniref:Acetylglutamate kinase n=3 Tax=Methylacidiphilum (ex Ratnadevi et al. 2023) TaxID=511745 RepID=I0JVE5_METFB|nr:acetylglutamate kinase [Candidatus Methylacidiphilum fumarolicum]MBW6414882.1 acetylglutamate kinase [Candidatus Methylacidiphilum fumarolicum]TFE68321.1 acetylglutamate kinase [Candidatus Methylacidiphilum fumarolicum]TFE73546.1 acetylglutamate kinase [Candidatus Methylacidiphilum fumarolicum]TFE74993.1 acetylglutamate kinase [Candidatus Methylacidiphilum fumarolicum]TFE76536.1 acetylglutamate kinase [Candidatus Methylacidiphilum fumarolicum]